MKRRTEDDKSTLFTGYVPLKPAFNLETGLVSVSPVDSRPGKVYTLLTVGEQSDDTILSHIKHKAKFDSNRGYIYYQDLTTKKVDWSPPAGCEPIQGLLPALHLRAQWCSARNNSFQMPSILVLPSFPWWQALPPPEPQAPWPTPSLLPAAEAAAPAASKRRASEPIESVVSPKHVKNSTGVESAAPSTPAAPAHPPSDPADVVGQLIPTVNMLIAEVSASRERERMLAGRIAALEVSYNQLVSTVQHLSGSNSTLHQLLHQVNRHFTAPRIT